MDFLYPNKVNVITSIEQAEGKQGLFYAIHPNNNLETIKSIEEQIPWVLQNAFEGNRVPAGRRTRLNVLRFFNWTRGEMEEIYENDINPIRRLDSEGSIVIWGNRAILILPIRHHPSVPDIAILLNILQTQVRMTGVSEFITRHALESTLSDLKSKMLLYDGTVLENNEVIYQPSRVAEYHHIKLEDVDAAYLLKELRLSFTIGEKFTPLNKELWKKGEYLPFRFEEFIKAEEMNI